MPIYQAVILGIVQGITEFLPISSTGHLRLIPRLFNWNDGGTTFLVALHIGTLAALLAYFYRDWLILIRCAIKQKNKADEESKLNARLFWGLMIGCIPAAIAGLLLDKPIEKIEKSKAYDNPMMLVIATALIVVGILLYLADRFASGNRQVKETRLGDWLWIGLAQAAALIPGVSRSGATIAAGIAAGLSRESAARFSFLLSMPVVLGAGLLKLKDLFEIGLPKNEAAPFAAGLVTSAVVGYLAIRFLLSFLQKHGVGIFVWYRILLGAVIIGITITRM